MQLPNEEDKKSIPHHQYSSNIPTLKLSYAGVEQIYMYVARDLSCWDRKPFHEKMALDCTIDGFAALTSEGTCVTNK